MYWEYAFYKNIKMLYIMWEICSEIIRMEENMGEDCKGRDLKWEVLE